MAFAKFLSFEVEPGYKAFVEVLKNRFQRYTPSKEELREFVELCEPNDVYARRLAESCVIHSVNI